MQSLDWLEVELDYYIFLDQLRQRHGPNVPAPSFSDWLLGSRDIQSGTDQKRIRKNTDQSFDQAPERRGEGNMHPQSLHVAIPLGSSTTSVDFSATEARSPASEITSASSWSPSLSPSFFRGSRSFTCGVCSKELASKQSLIGHAQAQHNGWRQFCPTGCGQSFSYPQALRRHIKKGRCPFKHPL